MLNRLTQLFKDYKRNKVSEVYFEFSTHSMSGYDFTTFDKPFIMDVKDQLKLNISNTEFIHEMLNDERFPIELMKEGNSDLLYISIHLGLYEINGNVKDENGRPLLEFILNDIISRFEETGYIRTFASLLNIFFNRYQKPSETDNEITISIINALQNAPKETLQFMILIRAVMKIRDMLKMMVKI